MFQPLAILMRSRTRSPTPSSLRASQSLPAELLHEVFHHLRYDVKTLASATLVCRAWSPTSSSVLLRMIRLWRVKNSFMRSSRLKTFLCHTKTSERLSAYVVNLTVSGLVEFMELQHTITLLKNLRSLTLNSVHFLLAKEKTYALLVPRKKLESCILIGDVRSKPVIGPSLYHALSWVCKVNHLKVYSIPAPACDARDTSSIIRPADSKVQVRELTVNGDAMNSSLADLAEMVELSSVVHLNISSLRTSQHGSFSALLRLHGHHLEKLNVTLMAGPLEGIQNRGKLSDDLSMLPVVRETAFNFLDCSNLHTVIFSYKTYLNHNIPALSSLWNTYLRSILQSPTLCDLTLQFDCQALTEDDDPFASFLLALDWSLLDQRRPFSIASILVQIETTVTSSFDSFPPEHTDPLFVDLIGSKVSTRALRALTFS